MMKVPKLRTVEKYQPPYPLNQFPRDFALNLGREVVYLLASRGTPRLEGSDWEEIFARLIEAQWKPSNVGLDDIVLGQTAWGAKTVKNSNPASVLKIRLISGRNSPVYSFGDREVSECDPNILGEKILAIWNERVAGVRNLFKHVRTVVLIKSDSLLELAVFEFDTALTHQTDIDGDGIREIILRDFKKHQTSTYSHGNLMVRNLQLLKMFLKTVLR